MTTVETAATCKLDHSAAGVLPPFLCRACHPELALSEDKRKLLDAEDRKRFKREAKEASRQREIAALERRLTTPHMQRAKPGSVTYKFKQSLERKLKKLKKGGTKRAVDAGMSRATL